MAETGADPSLRAAGRAADRHHRCDDAARAALREIYSRSTDAKIKEAALQGLLIADDEQGRARSSTEPRTTAEEKRALLRTLTTMDGDAALEAIDAALEGKK